MSSRRPTKRRVAIAISLVAAVLFAGLLFQAAVSMSEPRFEGKSLSYWLDQLDSIDIGPDGRGESIGLPGCYLTDAEARADLPRRLRNIKKAHEALIAAGTNHLEILVKRLKTKDFPLKLQLWQLADRIGIRYDYYDARFRRGQGLSAFQYLGRRAEPAIPQLVNLTSDPDTNIQVIAWSALERVSPEEFRKRPHPPIIEHGPTYR